MAVVYSRIGGRKLTKVLATLRGVQRAVDDAAIEGAIRADGYLNSRSKTRTGTSTINLEKGDVDSYVVLDDTRGLSAALSIEYGRAAQLRQTKNGVVEIGAAEGLWVLHDAFNLPHGR